MGIAKVRLQALERFAAAGAGEDRDKAEAVAPPAIGQPAGRLREAKKSGHYIQRDEPGLVKQLIKDVIRETATPILEGPAQ